MHASCRFEGCLDLDSGNFGHWFGFRKVESLLYVVFVEIGVGVDSVPVVSAAANSCCEWHGVAGSDEILDEGADFGEVGVFYVGLAEPAIGVEGGVVIDDCEAVSGETGIAADK